MTSKEYTPVAADAMDIEKDAYHPPHEAREYPIEMPNAPKISTVVGPKHSISGAAHKPSMSRMNSLSKKSTGRQRTCSHCGHISSQEAVLDIYPPPRPQQHIHQQSFTFIGYVLLIAIVIFLTFVAIKYIA